MLDALVVAPHPDDAELGMGGTIVRLMAQGWKVGILDLTSGEPTPPEASTLITFAPYLICKCTALSASAGELM